ncbi:aminotransferase class I/II-fold pyridoxal phosphate-dependent enzyme [Flavobacteriaceae bacterium S356]|uniref:Aminotransferase class I/II-fold pyridoxal phosphate-dependent enzyme n=1 Tax=Asprobacillus argus TaxID=3076534 RepID=A0ABU3LEA9_9FLAO|nr:aminotransferase class I/II-fold pyridoxal phosphate-dependent enzyme [Flavobacteriaceae bacterium S356]
MELLSTQHLLKEAYDPQNFRDIGHQLIDLLADHLEDAQTASKNVVLPYKAPEDELLFWQQHLQSSASPIDTFKTVLEHSIHIQDPRYMGHQTATVAPIASLAGLMSDLLNNGTGVFEMGPASNALEKLVTDLLSSHVGYDANASGILTSGGTLANLTALLAARKAKSKHDVWQDGHKNKLAVIVSEESHYCIDRATRIMGFGDDGIIKVPVDKNFRIKTTELENHYRKAVENGLEVIAVVGCACSTATGSYDDLEALAAFSKKHDLWFHVDGAHGGAAVFSEKHRHLVKGIELADSVVIDFHKMLMTPALTTALLFKEGKDVYKTFAQKAQYLWDSPQSEDWFNSGKRTFECTKLMMSIKVYIILKTYGIEVFEQNVNQLYDVTKDFANMISERSNFELLTLPEANILNFRYVDCKLEQDINEINTAIRQQLIEAGEFYIVQTTVGGQKYLRCTVMNPFTNKDHFKALLNEIENIGNLL